jgi:murein DD-endopeptidase MepM/ murein hydrolase activator NlpD
MGHWFKKILLFFLRGLIRVKRGLVLVGKGIFWVFDKADVMYRRTIGVVLYKIWYRSGKRLRDLNRYRGKNIVELFGNRGTLEASVFIIGVFVMLPHTSVYSRDTNEIAGRNTLLYKIVGPGDQNFDGETLEDVTALTLNTQPPAWRQGAVSGDTQTGVGTEVIHEVKEISSISSGGTALTKPIILPGNELPTTGASTQKRSRTISYLVKAGDTIGAIAEEFEVNVTTILWANNLSVRSYIRPGDTLDILPGNGVMHTVKSGDTISKIAQVYDAKAGDIIETNKLNGTGSAIRIGDVLFVPGGEKPQPKPVYRPPVVATEAFRQISAPPPSASTPAGSGYLWPTSVRKITQYYGWRHTGVDIGGPIGTPIYASRVGKVTKSQCGWNGGYGCYIILNHGGGIETLYAHNSQLYVSVGAQVSQGQIIAGMGSTGRSTGPHLHYEVRVNGKRQNPFQYVR